MIKKIWKNTPLILVVNDDDSMRMLLRFALEQDGYIVIEAANGKECLAAYQQYQPDAILLDLVMPVMDGFDCCRELRTLIKSEFSEVWAFQVEPEIFNNLIPIIITSIIDEDNFIEQCLALGVSDYIVKPVQWNLLRHRLRCLLQQALQAKVLIRRLSQQSTARDLLA